MDLNESGGVVAFMSGDEVMVSLPTLQPLQRLIRLSHEILNLIFATIFATIPEVKY